MNARITHIRSGLVNGVLMFALAAPAFAECDGLDLVCLARQNALGDRVRIEVRDGARWEGVLTDVTPERLTFQSGAFSREIPSSEVAGLWRLEVKGNRAPLVGAAIGAPVIGSLLFFLLPWAGPATEGTSGGSSMVPILGLIAGVGAVAGLVIGAVLSPSKTTAVPVYPAEP